ncbi:chlorophyll a/b-binding protein [Leptolyngbya sp. 7M]|uniref:chlorophyll a/b-binding protein n=1 Tax=Leptolyngbya sp. 7M TaxID=2812896 RepID=UPI001CECB270|nr:chlorophyll a/b-binding protein [Leptolyngbya sp. 7M]
MESLSSENSPANSLVFNSASASIDSITLFNSEVSEYFSAAPSSTSASDQSVQSDCLEELQSDRPNRNAFVFGFTPQAELWNGRLAMLAISTFLILRVMEVNL